MYAFIVFIFMICLLLLAENFHKGRDQFVSFADKT